MFNIGDTVKILNSSLYGKIIRKNLKKSSSSYDYLIKINNKFLNVSENLLEKADIQNIKKTESRNKKHHINSYRENVTVNLKGNQEDQNEIMLRHQTVEEAISNLDKFIDTAICNKLHRVKIIHGKSGGILRKAVHDYLSNNTNVEEYHLGGYFEGQFGVTIAILK